MTPINRRKLLYKSAQAIAAGGTALAVVPAKAAAGLPGGPNTIVVGVWMLQPGEEKIVARRLRELLQTAAKA